MLLFMAPCEVVPVDPIDRSWSNPNSFTPFSRLPPELRLKIWEYIYLQPRDMLIKYGKSITFSNLLFFDSRTPAPILLHICVESRELALKWYLRLPASHQTLTQPQSSPPPPAIPHNKRLYKRGYMSLLQLGRRALRREETDTNDETGVIPMYYSRNDPVFIMPRTTGDVIEYQNVLVLDDRVMLSQISSHWGFHRYRLRRNFNRLNAYTVAPIRYETPNIDSALRNALPGFEMRFNGFPA